jgi:hypothetical protein
MAGRLVIVLVAAAVLTGTAAAAAGAPEKRAITPADQAWAKRINLSLQDVPTDFVQGAAQPSGAGGFTCASFAPDLSGFTITGQASSHSFSRPDGTSLFSAAEVFRTSADERGDWQRSARRAALPCLAHMLERLSRNGVRLKVTSSTLRPSPRLGDRSISFRLAATISSNGASVKTWFDILAVARGRADATLAVISFWAPPESALEQSLLTKLSHRLSR